MITSHNIATLSDNNGKHNIEVEINKSGEGQNFVEMSMKDERGKKISAFIPIKELYALTFSIVGEDEQTDLMPVRKTTMTTFRRKYIIEAKRNIKKGEKITFTGEINVPTVVEEGLQGILEKKEVKSNLLVPI
jgi:hypothetical protein